MLCGRCSIYSLFNLYFRRLRHKKLHRAINIQTGEAKTNAKTKVGSIPFNPAVIRSSDGNRVATEVKIQATNIEAKLVITAIKTILLLDGLYFCWLAAKKANE